MNHRVVFTAADSNYFLQLGVLVSSLCETQSRQLSLKVMGTGWTDSLKQKILNLSTDIIAIEFIAVDYVALEKVKLSYGFPIATVYSLLGPLLAPDLRRLVYLDSDIVVMSDISELWELEFTEPVAAVVDSHIGMIGNPSMDRPWRELNKNPTAKYLNTGILVFNVNEWNRAKISENCLDLLNRFEMPCIDQDALSLTLDGNFYSMNPKYNLMPFHLTPKLRYSSILDDPDLIDKAILSPSIIHFHRSFLGKPWIFGCKHPAKNVWRTYAARIDPTWRKKFDLYGLVRNFAVHIIGLTKFDENVKILAGSKGGNRFEQL
jgi:lipopolysaccharide biosynthesis glycosyltransferase